MFRVHFLDVGNGDTTILQFTNGRTYLVDHNEVSGKTRPIDYLRETLCVDELETVVLTHQHTDHFRGVHRIFETIPVRQAWLSEPLHPTQSYQALEHLLEIRQDIRVLFPRAGTSTVEGKERIHLLAPPTNFLRGTHSDVNNRSIVLKITSPNEEHNTSTSPILGADAEIASWNQSAIDHGRHLQADLLRISHHGSQHGTDPETLPAIRPQYSVISVGNNPFGHPNPDTLALIEEHTSQRVLRTDVDGTCVFESDGVNWNPV